MEVVALACRLLGMRIEEALAAVTVNAAYAAGFAGTAGILEYGRRADLVALRVPDYRELPLCFGMNLVAFTMRQGRIIPASPEVSCNRRTVECVANFSEGSRRRQNRPDCGRRHLLGKGRIPCWTAIWTGTTIALCSPSPVEPDPVAEAAFPFHRGRLRLIDLRAITAASIPRIGAADVVPFVPLNGVSMEECVRLAGPPASGSGGSWESPSICTARRRASRGGKSSRTSAAAVSRSCARRSRADRLAPARYRQRRAPPHRRRRHHRRAAVC